MMKITRPEKKPILVVLIKRTIAFFSGLCLLLLFLYGIGSQQEFTDITQLMLLRGAVTVGFFLGCAACYGIVFNCWMIFHGRFRYLGGIMSYIILGALGLGVAVLGTFILILTGGTAA